ncbi:hypothetical protein ACHAXA_004810 [Cyclostephanos tholiformis]|uniref:UmuC domain-containing protein n=1 Tax=Cyclostephanos tholiformis TaxID=382380 RepID=A0ABD3RWR0_9STRA
MSATSAASSPPPGIVGNRRRREVCLDREEHDDDDGDNPDREHHGRVILLLDMDCFYAQCEVVRLGLDRSIPLALVQWNSALAVNYPARSYGIKRGDSYETIREKSGGTCVSIHLPVTPLLEDDGKTHPSSSSSSRMNRDGGRTSSTSTSSPPPSMEDEPSKDGGGDDGVGMAVVDPSESAYDAEYNRPRDERERMYEMEKNRMRSPSEGKACLDRYRLASSRIFGLIDDTLASNLGRRNYVLERASIDELFVDVTAFCYMSRNTSEGEEEEEENNAAAEEGTDDDNMTKFLSECNDTHVIETTMKWSVVCHESSVNVSYLKNDIVGIALRRGCHVAYTVRRAVLETLGFTLSAGISTNKLVAKLAATYGKPNGQAVIYPSVMPKVMEETQISKARMLGGKLGKKVMCLLPEFETTMGSISRLLSLDRLERAIGVESARWVFDACRGIDSEEVKATLKVLPKSITVSTVCGSGGTMFVCIMLDNKTDLWCFVCKAFKSFSKGSSYPELEKWTTLLARDIMKRVEVDNARNSRLPRSITVGYTMVPGGAWIGRTFRLPFPTDRDFNSRVRKLVDGTRKALSEKGHSGVIRIGFSAIDFVVRSKTGIDSFFSKGVKANAGPVTKRIVDGRSAEQESGGKLGGKESFFSSLKSSSPKTKGMPVSSLNSSDNNEICGVSPSPGKNPTRNCCAEVSLREMNVAEYNENLQDPMSGTSAHSMNLKNNLTDEDIARRLQDSLDEEMNKTENGKHSTSSDLIDKDEALALVLQSTYDREDALLSHLERFPTRKKNINAKRQPKKSEKNNKRGKIDFFLKR